MHKLLLILLSLSFSCLQAETLVTIDNEPISDSYFNYIYSKGDTTQSRQQYLPEFIDFQLKVKDARAMRLDTFPDYLHTMSNFVRQQQEPYRYDTAAINKSLHQLYERSKTNYLIQYIPFVIADPGTPEDTLNALKRAMLAKQLLITDPFDSVAVWTSDDPSVKRDLGHLPWISAGVLPAELEDAVYSHKVGEVVGPVRSPIGYHIFRIDSIRHDPGKAIVENIVELKNLDHPEKNGDAHIRMMRNYNLITEGYRKGDSTTVFDSLFAITMSQDDGGGLLEVSVNTVIPEIEQQAFALTRQGQISPLFESKFGYHIIRLVKRDTTTFEEDSLNLLQLMAHTDRMAHIADNFAAQFANTYKLTRFNENSKRLEAYGKKVNWNDSIFMRDIHKIDNLPLYSIEAQGEKRITTVQHLIQFMQTQKDINVGRFWLAMNQKITLDLVQAYLDDLPFSNPSIANSIHEQSDGLLLYSVMQQKVWKPAQNNSQQLAEFFNSHRNRYPASATSYHDCRGHVIADFQDELEKQWLEQLHQKYKVIINQQSLNALK